MTYQDRLVRTDTDAPEAESRPELSTFGNGRLARLALLFLSLLSVALVHLSWLPLEVQAIGHAVTNVMGQEVRWTMFSADPRGTSLDLWAELEFRDGTSSVWRIDRDDGGGDFGFYRTVKWMEGAVLDPKPGSLERFADWLIASSPKPIARVEIWTSQQIGSPPGMIRPEAQRQLVLTVIPETTVNG